MTPEQTDQLVDYFRALIENALDVTLTVDNGVNVGGTVGSTSQDVTANGSATMTLHINGGAQNNLPSPGMVQVGRYSMVGDVAYAIPTPGLGSSTSKGMKNQ